MTLPEPPLPTVRQLARALFPVSTTRYGRPAYWYGTASEALAAVIQALGRKTVWFPGYFCNEALRFVRRLPANLRFYDVRQDLSIDWDVLDCLIKKEGESHVFVLVHYFGFPNRTEAAGAFCKQRSIVLLEDAAHTLARTPGIGYGAAAIFSPRKLFAVPRGGLLLTDEGIGKSLPRPTTRDSSEILSWTVRRMMQKMLSNTGVPWHFLSAYRYPPAPESEIPNQNGFTVCSSYIQHLVSVAEQDIDNVIKARRAHYLQLLKACEGSADVQAVFPNLPEGVCPYVFPVQVGDHAQGWAHALRSKGVPASRWPDLPPEVADSGLFPQSVRLAEHTVLLPVHQSLSSGQMKRMARLVSWAK
jgi:dTDP-4-amino-4,6-dideoxygalactose transaminase